jgi:orotate phosphoribosyltransferase
MTIAKNIAQIALEVGAIRINAQAPFTWASGYKMPIYNDNRLLLGKAKHRSLITKGFKDLLKTFDIEVEVIAGTATAGIPYATSLADLLQVPLIYVRSSSKSHGMGNKIEGVLKKNQRVLIIEDLISTGGSAISAVIAIREAGGIVDHCFSIFSYGFTEASEKFKSVSCQSHPLLVFTELLQVAQSIKHISPNDIKTLQSWQKSPFKWKNKVF